MTIQNVAACVNGLTYKSLIPRGTKNLLEQGALVHMFEFAPKTNVVKPPPGFEDKFMNFTNALLGKATGAYSIHRSKLFFDEQRNILTALPCSGIRAGFPMELFTDQSNVGVLINPDKVKIMALQTQDSFSFVQGDNEMLLNHYNIFRDETLRRANFGDEEQSWDKAYINVHRTKEKYKELKELFKGHFWNLYSGGKEPGEKDFRKNIECAIKKNLVTEADHGSVMMTEILAHVKPEAIVGIVVYSDNKNSFVDYDKCKFEDGDYSLQGIMLANLLREKLKMEKNVSLPILHYHSNLNVISHRAEIFNFAEPFIREVNIENKKIASILNSSPAIKNTYGHYLGKDRVQEIITGKTDIVMGSK